jgi:hypothetical protein
MSPTIPQIISAVADQFEVTAARIKGPCRKSISTRPRFAVCALAKKSGWSQSQIGKRLGGRDHTSIMHAQRRADEIRGKDYDFEVIMKALEEAIISPDANKDEKRRNTFHSDCIAAIRKIAAGHAHPRGLAEIIINKFEGIST